MTERDAPSGHLTAYLESSTEAAAQLSRHRYLPALLGLVAAVLLAVALVYLLA